MKITVLSHEYYPIASGGVSLILELTEHLARQGFKITILTPLLPGTQEYEKISDSIEIIRINTKRKSLGNASLKELLTFGFLAVPAAIKMARQGRVDCFLSIFLVPAGLVGAIAKLFSGKPHVVFIGGADLPSVSSKFGRVLGKIKFLLRWILHKADTVLTAEGLENDVKKLLPSVNQTIVRNGAEVSCIAPPQREGREDKPIQLLTIGRLIERKGFFHLIDALNLVDKPTLEKLRLTIVGYGPIENELAQRIKKYGLENNVIMAGGVPKKELPKYYEEADAYVFYAEPEGTSLAMVEAMAYELPVITSDVPGNRELCQGNGFAPEYGNAQLLAKIITEFAGLDRGKLHEMGQQSRKIAKGYDWAEISKIYGSAIRQTES